MKPSAKTRFDLLTKLRWVARISSLISILILFMFFVGEGFQFEKVAAKQWVALAFFPGGLITGFIVGWKNELLGGSISVVSLLCFYLVYGFLISGSVPRGYAFAVLALPAIIFLFTGFYAETAIGKRSK